MIRFRLVIAVLALLPSPAVAQSIEFDDGGQHVLSDSLKDIWITVSNGTTLTFQGDATFLSEEISQPTMSVEGNSRLIHDGGTIDGYDTAMVLLDSVGEFSSGTVSSAGPASGVGARIGGTSSVMIAGTEFSGSGESWGTGLLVEDDSIVVMSGGSLNGSVDFPNLGIGLDLASNHAMFELVGGKISGRNVDGNSLGVRSTGQFVVRGGEISAHASASSAVGVAASDGRLEIHGGRFSAFVAGEARPPISAVALELRGGTTAEIFGGDFVAETGGIDHQLLVARALAVNDSTNVIIHEGTFTARTVESFRDISSDAVAIHADGKSTISIKGGTFQAEAISGPTREVELLASGESTIRLFGSGFNHTILAPLDDLAGEITGTLSDGSAINLRFERSPTATVILVPEPSTLGLLIAGCLMAAHGYRRERR